MRKSERQRGAERKEREIFVQRNYNEGDSVRYQRTVMIACFLIFILDSSQDSWDSVNFLSLVLLTVIENLHIVALLLKLVHLDTSDYLLLPKV